MLLQLQPRNSCCWVTISVNNERLSSRRKPLLLGSQQQKRKGKCGGKKYGGQCLLFSENPCFVLRCYIAVALRQSAILLLRNIAVIQFDKSPYFVESSLYYFVIIAMLLRIIPQKIAVVQ